MGISPAEVAIHRANTRLFIAADSANIVLWRSEWADDGAGGLFRLPPGPLPAQTMRFMPRQDGGAPRLTADGEQVVPTYTLLGEHDADMSRWDTLLVDGIEYEVVFVYENTQYQVKGEVAYRGAR